MSFTEYLVRSTLVFAAFFLPYQLLFHRQTFFQWQRFYLLSVAFLSLLLPLLPSPAAEQAVKGSLLPVYVTQFVTGDFPAEQHSYAFVLPLLYFSGLLFFTGAFIFRLAKLLRMIRSAERNEDGTYQLASENAKQAFSFFGYLFLPAGIDPEIRRTMLLHERVHIRQKHSFDLLFFELLQLLFWFNPLYRVARNQLSATHEFIADEQACGDDPVHYKQVLVAHVLGLPRTELIHAFSEPGNLKKRIMMLNKNKTAGRARWSYLLAFPLIALALSLNSFTFGGDGEKVDKMPEYSGGQAALVSYMGTHVHYPEKAVSEKTAGTVYVSFTVEKTGKVTGAKVVKSVSPELDAEALRVVSSMPDWIPGETAGEKVAVEMTLPVKFALN